MGGGTYRRLREGRESASEMIDLKGDGVEGAGLGVAPGHSLGASSQEWNSEWPCRLTLARHTEREEMQ